MTLTHEEVVKRALGTLADLDTYAEALRKQGFDVDGAVRKLSILLLEMEAEEADGCLSDSSWSDVIRGFPPASPRRG
jgi:hypothetical protein